jgi:hypothetical protein
MRGEEEEEAERAGGGGAGGGWRARRSRWRAPGGQPNFFFQLLNSDQFSYRI